MKGFLAFAVACFSIGLAGAPRSAASDAPVAEPQTAAAFSPHVVEADKLVDSLKRAQINEYSGKREFIDFSPAHAAAHCVCSGFIALLIEHTYSLSPERLKQWLGTAHPGASDLYDAIASHRNFNAVATIADIRPGDILAIRFLDDNKDTGHVVMIDQLPVAMPDSAPLAPGLSQYSVAVIDSTGSGHGSDDTRWRGQNAFTGGVGRGTIRLYADATGAIKGYTWSTSPHSKFCGAPTRPVIVGRLTGLIDDVPDPASRPLIVRL
jgi:hypothetical protein